MVEKSEIYYCDRCGKKLEEKPLFYINSKYHNIPNMRIEILYREWTFADLCDDCKRYFIKWWKGDTE